jgi:hypothetical protein
LKIQPLGDRRRRGPMAMHRGAVRLERRAQWLKIDARNPNRAI